MGIWECQSCGFRYHPSHGDPARGIPAGTAFEALPPTWRCPECSAELADFDVSDLAYLDDLDEPSAAELAEDDADLEEEDEQEDRVSLDEDSPDEDPLAQEVADTPPDEDDAPDDLDAAFAPLEDDEDDAPFDESDDEDAPAAEEDPALLEDLPDDDPIPDDEEDAPLEEDAGLAANDLDSDADVLADDEDSPIDPFDDVDLELGNRFRCSRCGWVYDPCEGHPAGGIAPGTPFVHLAEPWTCPACSAALDAFEPDEERPLSASRPAASHPGISSTRTTVPGDPISAPAASPESPAAQTSSAGLSDLLFRPAGIFAAGTPPMVSSLTQLGRHAARPLHLTAPLVLAPVPGGQASGLLKQAVARASARLGIACTSGGEVLGEALRATPHYILELSPGGLLPGPGILEQAAALEVILGPRWTAQEGREAAVGHAPSPATPGVPFGADPLPPILQPRDLERLIERLRRDFPGPIGVRLPAGNVAEDVRGLLVARPDFITLEANGSSVTGAPAHVRMGARLPDWWAVAQARAVIAAQGEASSAGSPSGRGGPTLLVAGAIHDGTDLARLLALGADAVVLADELLPVIGLEATANAPAQARDPALLELLVDVSSAVEHLVTYVQDLSSTLIELSRLCGHGEVRGLNRHDLFTTSPFMARALGLEPRAVEHDSTAAPDSGGPRTRKRRPGSSEGSG